MNQKNAYNPVEYDSTFFDFVARIGASYAQRPAVTWFTRKQQEMTRTYSELTRDICALRAGLAGMGCGGDHIAILGENSYEWLVAYLAITSGGGVAVCIDAEQSDDSIRRMLSQADAAAAFVCAPYRAICQGALPEERLFSLDGKGGTDSARTFEGLCAAGRAALDAGGAPASSVSPDQTAVIVFTSGTSSDAKPVELTHRNILQNTSDSILYVWTYERVFSHLPFYHTYGMTCGVLSTLVHGFHAFISGDLRTMMRDLRLSLPDTVMTVPLVLETIHNQLWLRAEQAGKAASLKKLLSLTAALRAVGISRVPKALRQLRQEILGDVRIIITGGAALSPELEREFSLLGVMVLQGYGITECSPLLAVNGNRCRRAGSVGRVLPSFQLRLENGEIWVKGPSLMPGYYRSPELTAEVMEDGWFKTGDLGHVDRRGYLFITGRKKYLIVFQNGKKVSPEKMEALLQKLPLVKEVLVYGVHSGAATDDIKLAASIYPDPDRAAGMNSFDILASLRAAPVFRKQM